MSPIDNEYLEKCRVPRDFPELLDALHGPRTIFLQDLLAEILEGQSPRKPHNGAMETSAATSDSES